MRDASEKTPRRRRKAGWQTAEPLDGARKALKGGDCKSPLDGSLDLPLGGLEIPIDGSLQLLVENKNPLDDSALDGFSNPLDVATSPPSNKYPLINFKPLQPRKNPIHRTTKF
jgi:hypothetical protein